ncbi:hypothetical protein SAMN05216226_11362 [Halovenus aranensis]|jgi:hypothetical protein|uniref:Uncharacterized protein n=1 Tax=Halovenus aranensis TaxID=890420 RepID=A0A1G8Y3P9_9EURY|nr:hypothetical protein [Halovenus aranensis]SDJ97436.1 hypothetical protein SAMN05216226_11362 [Halovenus aranensis]
MHTSMEMPSVDRLDGLALLATALLLVFAYVVYPDPMVKFTVWLIILTIYMTWFCYFGVKWLYDVYM